MRASGLFALGALCAALALAAIPTAAVAQGFNAVYTQDGVDVWAVGDAGAVYRSLDGGATWGSYPVGAVDHNGLAARGTGVWIVDDGGAVWRSTDSGTSFASSSPAGAVDLNAVAFADASTGWIVGNGGTILKTTDGGASWMSQESGVVANLLAVRFSGLSEGWASGGGGTVLHTTNGGSTWASSTPFAFTKDLYDVDLDGSTVYVSGTYGFLAKSTNAGGSWSTVNLWLDTRSDVNGVEVLPGGTMWICGGGGFLRKSADGAATWSFAQHPIVTGMTDVYFHDASNGWACAGRSKNVARTTDGGASWSVPGGGAFTYTWSQKQANGTASIRGDTFDVDPVNRDKIYAVQGKTVYASWNRGDTWTAIATISGSGTRTNSFFVSPTDTNTWVAAVQDGDRVTRTTDGGATWTAVRSVAFTEYGMPLEQDVNDGNVLYFGPEDGRIHRSTDFGATWVTLANDTTFRSPCDVVVVSGNPSVLYVGDGVTGSGNGRMYRSTNGGLHWDFIYQGSGSEIPTVGASWIDPAVAYSTHWSSGGVRRTTNMGANWTSVATTSSAWGCDVSRDDPYAAMYGVYSGGTSYFTTNGGVNFQTASLTGSNYAIFVYDRGTLLAHQSGGLYKATINQPDMPVNNSQTVALVSPNGGETWQYNEVRSITWSSQNVAAVKLEYQTAPANPWQLIVASTPGPAGSYPWSVPNDPTSQAKVRVSDAGDGAPIDESNASFAIVVPAISSVQPSLDFGEVDVGSSRTDTLRIVNSGTATLVITSVVAKNGGPFAPSRTSFSIAAGSSDTVAVTFSPAAVQFYDDVLQITNNSPTSPFEVPMSGTGLDAAALAIVVPDGGEAWQYNTQHDVQWTSNLVNQVKIEYQTTQAGAWTAIADSVPASPAAYAWTIPATPSTDARVRVSEVGNPSRSDVSAAPFSILVQDLAAAPLAIDFGGVPAFHTAWDTVRVSNPGTGTLTVLSIGSDSASFTPSRTSFILSAGQSDTVAVFFTPTEERAYTGTLTITSDAPDPTESMSLTGAGTSPVAVATNGLAPTRFELRASSPNPFGDRGTAITYAIPREEPVSLVVYNASGQAVATLVEGKQPAGVYTVLFPRDAARSEVSNASLPSGVYFYRLTAGEFAETRQMVLVR